MTADVAFVKYGEGQTHGEDERNMNFGCRDATKYLRNVLAAQP